MAALNQCFFLFCAGLSTILGLYEGCASVISGAFGWGRKKGVLVVGVILFILSIPTILSTTVWSGVKPLGMDLFTFMDFVAMLITLPIGAILISIYAGTKFWEKYLAHAAQGANYFTIPRFLKFWYIIVLPLVTALVVVVGIAGYF